MLPPPPRSTLFPYTTLFRSSPNICWSVSFVVRVSSRTSWSSPDRKSTRLNSSHEWISYAVFCLKKKKDAGSAGGDVERSVEREVEVGAYGIRRGLALMPAPP